jgi:hypothetical protein
MNKIRQDVFAHAANWPLEDQEELAGYAREIEARRSGIYTMSDDEPAAVRTGLAEADRAEFVPDDLVAKADKRHVGCRYVTRLGRFRIENKYSNIYPNDLPAVRATSRQASEAQWRSLGTIRTAVPAQTIPMCG